MYPPSSLIPVILTPSSLRFPTSAYMALSSAGATGVLRRTEGRRRVRAGGGWVKVLFLSSRRQDLYCSDKGSLSWAFNATDEIL